ncbi:hypothetical protein IF1G_05082 [Cordyceps javanica]|uniref:Uncharacterized protein n=1 Tax=Cordyceps javanica TaxID=43265 RepID=A0A545V461_9HYPO|nr:hypothetical protein IF1G_05082 [Cordyceps javanica]
MSGSTALCLYCCQQCGCTHLLLRLRSRHPIPFADPSGLNASLFPRFIEKLVSYYHAHGIEVGSHAATEPKSQCLGVQPKRAKEPCKYMFPSDYVVDSAASRNYSLVSSLLVKTPRIAVCLASWVWSEA